LETHSRSLSKTAVTRIWKGKSI